MKLSDHLDLAFSNLRKRKLRTFLTAFGVTIGIGALVSMVSFGKGIQKNVTSSFVSLDLFNSITVLPEDFMGGERRDPDSNLRLKRPAKKTGAVLDDAAIAKIAALPGVETVFPEIRIPALIRYEGNEELRLVQVIPARIAASRMVSYRAGKPYGSDDEKAVVISTSLLRQLGVRDPQLAVGKTVVLSSISLDFSRLNPLDWLAALGGDKLPFATEDYELNIAGVAEDMSFGGPSPLSSDVFVPPGTAVGMKRLPFSSIWDLFRAKEGRLGYSALNVRLSSPQHVDRVKEAIKGMGFGTFALIDQFNEIRRGFLIMNMVLAAVGMIAIVVASLGIINTMVMSILERYSEIGIMKAVGAGDGDIRRIFFFESSAIGFLGGLFGFALGWLVSGVINRVVNYFLARQGVPFIDYFSFPLWLFLGALLFSVAVSLAAGVYPAMRAARVDPVRALRHE
jgi:putative ABC transport system permease protein